MVSLNSGPGASSSSAAEPSQWTRLSECATIAGWRPITVSMTGCLGGLGNGRSEVVESDGAEPERTVLTEARAINDQFTCEETRPLTNCERVLSLETGYGCLTTS